MQKGRTLQDYLVVLGKVGTESVQNYILNLGRFENPELSLKEQVIIGDKILTKLINQKYITLIKQNRTTICVPNISEELYVEQAKKYYPIRTEQVNITYSAFNMLNDISLPNVLHSSGIERLNQSNVNVLHYLNNIALRVTDRFSNFERIPNKEKAKDYESFKLETKLFKETQQDYNNKAVYFYHQFDRRGRIYCKGYTLNYQGDKYSKNAFDLDNKEIISNKGMVWLGRDIANLYGLDKESFKVKDEWFKNNKDLIVKTAKERTYHSELENPSRFIKACEAFVDADKGKAIGYLAGIDASASGISIISCLANDYLGLKYTNVINDENNRYDIYNEFTKAFLTRIGKDNPSKEQLAKARKVIKKVAMTLFYNSESNVKQAFNYNNELINNFIASVREICPNSYDLMLKVRELYYNICKDFSYMSYELPDGFQVVLPQYDLEVVTLDSLYYRCSFNLNVVRPNDKNMRSLFPNITHSLDAFLCRELIRGIMMKNKLENKSIEVLPIHDCFYSHPNNLDTISSIYSQTMNKLYNKSYGDILESIIHQLQGNKGFINPFTHSDKITDLSMHILS